MELIKEVHRKSKRRIEIMSLTEGQKIRIEIKAIIEIQNINIIAHNARITREVYNENKRINIYH